MAAHLLLALCEVVPKSKGSFIHRHRTTSHFILPYISQSGASSIALPYWMRWRAVEFYDTTL